MQTTVAQDKSQYKTREAKRLAKLIEHTDGNVITFAVFGTLTDKS